MESYSSALSYFHQSVQDNTGLVSISSNEQHSSDSVFSATANTSSASSDGSTSVHGNASQRKRQRISSSIESNETNFVPPRKKHKKYANLPDDVAELKRLKVNQLEKERQRQLNEVFQELKDLNLPELVDPGTRKKKYSKSYIVRNTHCILQHLHNERHRLHQKLQQKIQRQELVLVGQGIIPNNGQGNLSEILGQVQPQYGVEGVQKVACIGYSDFILASSITTTKKTTKTSGSKCMQTPVNLSSDAGINSFHAQHQTPKVHNYQFNPSSDWCTNLHKKSSANAGLFVFGERGQTQQLRARGSCDHIIASSNTLVNQPSQALLNTGRMTSSNIVHAQHQTGERRYDYGSSCYNDNFYARNNTLAHPHIQATVNAGRHSLGNVGCSQMYNAGTATRSTGYIVPGNAGDITPANANAIASVKSNNFLSGYAGNIAPVHSRNVTSANTDNIARDTFGCKLPVDALHIKQDAGDVAYDQSSYLLYDNAGNVKPSVSCNNIPVRSINSNPAYCSENLVPDSFGRILPVNIKPGNAANIYNGYNSHSNTGYNNTSFFSGYNGPT